MKHKNYLPKGWRVLHKNRGWGILHHPHGLWSRVWPPPDMTDDDWENWMQEPPELAQGLRGLEILRRQGTRGQVEWQRALFVAAQAEAEEAEEG